MKKSMLILFTAVLLAGCGGNSDKVSKTCTMEEDGTSTVLEMEAKEDTLTKVAMHLGVTYEAIDIKKSDLETSDEATEMFLGMMKELLLEELEMSEDEGYNVETKLGDKGFEMTISAEANLFEQTFDATSLSEMVTSLEKDGFECK